MTPTSGQGSIPATHISTENMSGLTCVVLHHVLVVSVGRLAELHAHVGVAARPPRQQTEARARVHHLRTE